MKIIVKHSLMFVMAVFFYTAGSTLSAQSDNSNSSAQTLTRNKSVTKTDTNNNKKIVTGNKELTRVNVSRNEDRSKNQTKQNGSATTLTRTKKD